MKCSACGNVDAFLGLTTIDCPNPQCKHFQGNKNIVVAPVVRPPQPGQPIPGHPRNGGGIAAPPSTLSVAILAQTIKASSILISFKGAGDPGMPDKRVEFYFTVPGGAKTVCTLSNAFKYYVDGIDADNQTTYTTHWLCTIDGVQPNDPYTLEATIF